MRVVAHSHLIHFQAPALGKLKMVLGPPSMQQKTHQRHPGLGKNQPKGLRQGVTCTLQTTQHGSCIMLCVFWLVKWFVSHVKQFFLMDVNAFLDLKVTWTLFSFDFHRVLFKESVCFSNESLYDESSDSYQISCEYCRYVNFSFCSWGCIKILSI